MTVVAACSARPVRASVKRQQHTTVGQTSSAQLLEERMRLAGPAERARRAALLEMKEGVLHGDERSRFGSADNS